MVVTTDMTDSNGSVLPATTMLCSIYAIQECDGTKSTIPLPTVTVTASSSTLNVESNGAMAEIAMGGWSSGGVLLWTVSLMIMVAGVLGA